MVVGAAALVSASSSARAQWQGSGGQELGPQDLGEPPRAPATRPQQIATSPPPPPAPPSPPASPSGYAPRSPFADGFHCAFVPSPRCGTYPFLALGVTGGAAFTPIGSERVVRPYAELGVMKSLNHWLDFGAGLLVAYDELEATSAATVESKLRLRMWMPSGFFGDVYAGPAFSRFAFPGYETGTRAGVALGGLFSFSDLIGLEGGTTILGEVGGQGGDEFRYMLGVRFSLTALVFAVGAIAGGAGKAMIF